MAAISNEVPAFALEDRPADYAEYTDDQHYTPLLGLSHYKPIYFLVGTPHTKIQLSFKTQIASKWPIYFAYTQLMLWNLFINSPFFYDINYNPSFFYRMNINSDKKQWLDLIPWEHESNGRGGETERSWNLTAIVYHFRFKLWNNSLGTAPSALSANIKAWVPYVLNGNNKNLARHRGVWQIDLGLSNILGHNFDFADLVLRAYPGGKSLINPLQGAQELTFRAKLKDSSFLPLFVFQIFHGYAESLLDYSKINWGVRLGLGF